MKGMSTEKTINVTVVYIAAPKPFEQKDGSADETLATLKSLVLNAFGLKEGPTPDGNNVTYRLYHQNQALDNLNETIGAVAGHAGARALKLSQQITQG